VAITPGSRDFLSLVQLKLPVGVGVVFNHRCARSRRSRPVTWVDWASLSSNRQRSGTAWSRPILSAPHR
jgi:hypothetical protein